MTFTSGIKHKKKLLAMLVSCALHNTSALAQQEDATSTEEDVSLEEVIVIGVRGSQAKAIDIKRNSANVVDSIVAEDIGKLPDTTITDSLQRITGVQIKREANEGTSLNVRGMPQVLTTLNGEQFLSPWTITSVGANYSDIPAGMISGADVYKSQSANLLSGGISGLVDLKTFSPTALDEGLTAKGRFELSQGNYSDKEIQSDGDYATRNPDYNASVILGYNFDGRHAVTLSAFQSSTYNANYSVWENQRLAFLDTPGGTPGDPLDLDNDGDTMNDWYLVPEEFSAGSNFMERERQGASSSFEFELTENWAMRGDVFYTRMDQFDRGVKIGFNSENNPLAYEVNGNRATYTDENGDEQVYLTDLYDNLQPGTIVGEGHSVSYTDQNGDSQTRQLHALLVAEAISPEFQTTSSNQINRTAALNTNLQFDYDNLDNLTASVRYVYAEAEKRSRHARFQQGTPAWFWKDLDGINGKDPLNSYPVTVDYRGDVPTFDFVGDLSSADFLEMYQGFADGENTEASLNVLRADAEYTFDSSGVFTAVSGGVRHGVRSADHVKFFYVTPTQRYSTWDDPRVAENRRFTLREGNEIWEKYPEWRRFDYASEDSRLIDIGGMRDNGFSRADTFAFTDFGPIEGFEGGVSSLNPADWDNPLDFMNRLYADPSVDLSVRTVEDPGFTYAVEEATTSAYAQLDFDNPDGVFGIPFSGDFGVRVVRTQREVEKSIVPAVLDRFNSVGYDDWDKIAFVSSKEVVEHSYTDIFPSANISFFPHDDVVVRFGASKTTSRNNLENLGSGLALWYQQCIKTDENGDQVTVIDGSGNRVGENVSCVGGGDDRGDPYMDPWRAAVYNSAVEWYFADNAILGAGVFLIDIESSVDEFQDQRSFLDGDGIDRGRTANIWTTDNTGASDLLGLEVGYKQPLTFLPSVFAHTGIEFNYTYSQSESAYSDVNGDAFPLQSNSKHQTNFIYWYDHEGLNVRLAYNWRSKEYLGRVPLNTNEAALNLGNWAESAGYLDLSVNYWLNDNFSFYLNGTNLTEQNRKSYAQYEEQFQSLWVQERRVSLGATISF